MERCGRWEMSRNFIVYLLYIRKKNRPASLLRTVGRTAYQTHHCMPPDIISTLTDARHSRIVDPCHRIGSKIDRNFRCSPPHRRQIPRLTLVSPAPPPAARVFPTPDVRSPSQRRGPNLRFAGRGAHRKVLTPDLAARVPACV
jgi:hypothetical protein